ncbi:tyrosine phosphatase [Heterostelium album PN500]|uniref:M-phase inducer phosphatase n=1 Tax=Heterostelium pallidum (strain ATCC 26659 / Pp 5 / PN500) TaxID=670386 RepID=D3B778_HETP5|nr:tyrosine phosphatase [Heterostelium album PN500]EFA82621.1 tyrosine phosphatase [Heterostelium album PN500]|eukprot:XP_020434738.1 tyrosine phosphatase [Heterostelium album PN500]
MVLVVTSKDSSTTINNNNNNIKSVKLAEENYDSNKENNFNQNNIPPTPLTPKQSAPVPVLPPSQQRQTSPRQQPAILISNTNVVATVAIHHQHHHNHPHNHHQQTSQFTTSSLQLPNNPFINCTASASSNLVGSTGSGSSHSDFHPRPSNHKRDSQLLSNSMPSLTTFFNSNNTSQLHSSTPPATPRFIEDGPHDYIGSPDRVSNCQEKPFLKKSRNSQTILRLDHLSIDQGIPSPLSRSTSELSIADCNDNNTDYTNSFTTSSITRSNTFCGEFPSSSTNLRRSLSRQLDFSAPHINIPNSNHLPFTSYLQQSISSPSSPLMAPSQVEPFSLSAPNTFLLSGAYPSSPEASPASTPIKDHHLNNNNNDSITDITPMKIMTSSSASHSHLSHPVTPNITMTNDPYDVDSPISSSPSQPSTPLMELLNNCDFAQPQSSPYKTPSKSHSHFVSRFSDSSYIATQSLYQSSDSILNFKKRGRTDLQSYNGFIAPSLPTSKSFINFSTTSSELCNSNNNIVNSTNTSNSSSNNSSNSNSNNSTNANNSTTVSPNTWKKASPDVSKPLPFEKSVFITNSNTSVCDETEYNLKLPLCNGKPGYNNITPETLAKLMEDVKNNITVVDCRYTYEYNGGHIKNAINIPPHHSSVSLQKNFFDKPPANNKRIIIFHCEFSSKRAPDCYSLFRDIDRKSNCYPNVHYPEIYLLNGGYKKFFETFPEKCTKDYIKMDDPRFTKEKRKEEEKKKKEEAIKSKLGRSQSFHG